MSTFIVALVDLEWYFIDVNNLGDFSSSFVFDKEDILVSFQTTDLIREISSREAVLPIIIDLESLEKQVAQEGKDLRNYSEWKVLKRLKYHKIIDPSFKITRENIKDFLQNIFNFYKFLIEKDSTETARFENIERKINAIIHKVQKAGISVNLEIAEKRCKELEKIIYVIKNELQLKHLIFAPDNIKAQIKYIKERNYPIIKSPFYTFRIRKRGDEVCRLFYELIRNQRDLDSLLFMLSQWGGKKHTHPTYLGFGTITSRIILREPSLQNLRKSNRDIIVPDKGMKLLYIDYAQFEAGILASLSKDAALINLYKSDIYIDIATKVLGDKNERSDAKIIFYRYMYGDRSLPKEAILYFQQFDKLQAYEAEVKNELLKEKIIGTENGNFRKLYEDETGWALSHKVQATASYIYKSALIRVADEVKSAEFLIPMHDGTVYQIPIKDNGTVALSIKNIYKEEFQKICPDIEPIFTVKDSFQ
ncbi:DNA polymerase [Niabella pedocola]|uniref:DNA polymerase n=1 Tax=Niabella pedocola TaxID=1752077 RepID=A0ABS8PL01_9BACT|nr:DNA polymerase [Niabella pedocola]MCD2421784.1 DNA polymerase [Niabella pedocola]